MLDKTNLFEKIAETIPTGIVVIDKEGNMIYINSQIEKMFEINKEDFLERSFHSPSWRITDLSGNPIPQEELPINFVMQTSENLFNSRMAINLPNEKKKYISVNHAPLFDETGELEGVVCSITDISQLKESEEKFKSLAEQSIFGILILQDGKFKYINQTFTDMTQYTVEEMLNWGPLEFLNTIHPEDRERVAEQVKHREEATDKGYHRYQFRGFKKNGELIYSEIWSKPIIYEGRNATFITSANITDKKETEEKYFNAFNRAEFYKDLFAHDINNILQNIKSANDLLNLLKNKEDFTQRFEEIHQMIDDQVNRGAKLVTNLRKLSKIEEKEVHTKSIELCSVLNEAISAIKKICVNKKINIQIKSKMTKAQVIANEFLSDVFDNILINAVKHNSHDIIEITIILEKVLIKNTSFVKIQFIDNGIGISDDRKNLIFQRDYYKKNNSTKGMGVGLSLVKKIIDSYQGEISVKDRIKDDFTKGSIFSILIPEAIPKRSKL